MHIYVLKAKLHHARVTQTELEYEGSCAIDDHLLNASGIREYEQIQIYNIDNGKRFTTYAIRAEKNSGIISLNGAAARQACVGDRVIICAYGMVDAEESKTIKPNIVHLDAQNKISRRTNDTPMQVIG